MYIILSSSNIGVGNEKQLPKYFYIYNLCEFERVRDNF